ncbi:MAG: DUF4465 domain-containing protein [Pirellulales bacterium]|nr:DUF4465 domain-containing protein [Pirellulales bacterium]
MLIRLPLVCLMAAASLCSVARATSITVDFDNLLPADSYENGKQVAGPFNFQEVYFSNYFDNTFGDYWEGWAYSTKTDTTTGGYTNQYSAFPGSGAESAGYGVGFTGGFSTAPVITLPDGYQAQSMMVTNSTYAALAIRDGNDGGFGSVRQFGAGDFFKLEITGRDGGGAPTGSPIDVYLADYRNGASFLASQWETIDLSPLGPAKTLHFMLSSTDNDPVYGMNTPAYFAIDQLVLQSVPEPAAWLLAIGCIGFLAGIKLVRRPAGSA